MVVHLSKKFLIGMKTLKESLFDDDLVTRDVCFGDLYDVKEWGGSMDDDLSISYGLDRYCNYDHMIKILDKNPKWKKFIKWDPPKNWKPKDYSYDEFRFQFTRIIMSCSSVDEITEKINELIQESSKEGRVPIRVKADILTQPRTKDISMFVLRFNIDLEDYICWMTVNKKEN